MDHSYCAALPDIGIRQRDRGRVYAGILVDHDFQEQRITQIDQILSGSDLIRVIVRNISRRVKILVHSMNISRAPLMVETLEKSGFCRGAHAYERDDPKILSGMDRLSSSGKSGR